MSLVPRAVCGALAGVAATGVLTMLRKSLAAAGVVDRTAPEQVVGRLEELGLLEGWSPRSRRVLTVTAHFAYGVGIGAVFGALRRSMGEREDEASVGAALGVLGWALNWTAILPAAGVHRQPWRQHTPKVLLPLLDHAVFGAAWGLVYRRLRRAGGV